MAVVTYERNLQQLQKVLESIDKPVGIYVLRKNGKLGTVRKPQRYIGIWIRKLFSSYLEKVNMKVLLLSGMVICRRLRNSNTMLLVKNYFYKYR